MNNIHAIKRVLAAQPFEGLFDQFGYPAFGASMRLLGGNYSGGLVEVRAFNGSADQGTADIMPYKIGDEYWVDLNSTLENLDATAIGRGLTTSDTLGDLLSSGVNDYDGFVTTWFDQSGNANDATQSTAASQPQIASAGSLITENGKPAVEFDVTTKYLRTSAFTTIAQPYTFFDVVFANNSIQFIRDGLTSTERSALYIITTTRLAAGNTATYSYTNNIQSLYTSVYNGASTDLAQNGSAFETQDAGTNSITGINIGGNLDNSAFPFLGRYQELIFYPSDQSADRTNIETNINNAFSIY